MQAIQEATEATSPRERILSAARKIFLDGPPEHATMDAVAQQAGMSKKTIYREFKSQLELLGALLHESLEDMGEFPPPKPGDDVELELYSALVRMVTHVSSPRSMALMRLLISEVRRYPELLLNAPKQPRGGPRDVLTAWLSAPTVRAKYQIEDSEDAAQMLLGMVMQDSVFKLIMVPTATMPHHLIETRARRAVAIYLKGVRK
ncbi:MAG TPA: TetR/AcrR family transcriptional regulator [Hyphomonadaceae bacterium]|jgi:AcrR family transcriptional regulator|nr:TetR/AcrR family transcriptional regulator [Hyphomonadaceae bacterium]